MPDIRGHLKRNLVQAEALGQAERAKKLKARLAELDEVEEPKAEPVEEAPVEKPAAKKKPAKAKK